MADQRRDADFKILQRQMGERIRWARELVEPSATVFARVLGLHRSTILKIEDGSRAPSLRLVFDISRRLRVTSHYILTGSLSDADPEIAHWLLHFHPELRGLQPLRMYHMRRGQDDGSNVQPMTPKRA